MPGERDNQVVVDYIALSGQDSHEHGESEEEQSQEAGLAHSAVGRTKDEIEITAVFAHADEYQAYGRVRVRIQVEYWVREKTTHSSSMQQSSR